MGQEHWLGRLKMGVSRHYQVDVLLSLKDQHTHELPDETHVPFNGIPYIEPDVQGYLVIPAPARMYLLPCHSDLIDKGPFNERVDVLVVIFDGEFTPVHLPLYLPQSADDLGRLILSDDPLFGQHAAMGHGPGNVLAIEPPVKADG